MALGFAGLAPGAQAAGGTISDCADSTALAAAVAAGGTWTFACSGTIVVDHALDASLAVTLVVPTTQNVVIQQGAAGDSIFVTQGKNGTLTLTGNGHLTLEGGRAALSSTGPNPLVSNGFLNTVRIAGTTVTDTVVGATYAAVVNGGYMTVTDSTFTHNHGDAGGALANAGEGTTLTVTGTVFTDNHADYTTPAGSSLLPEENGGGAIFNGGGTLTVADSTFTDNSAVANAGASDGLNTGSGGAILNEGSATITASTFQGNQATGTSATLTKLGQPTAAAGGAVADAFGSGGLVISNSTLTGNSAVQGGGGVAEANFFMGQGSVSTSILNTTFASNTSASDGDNLAVLPAPGDLGTGLPPVMKNDVLSDPKPASTDCYPVVFAPAPTAVDIGDLEQGDGSCGTYTNGPTFPLAGWTEGGADLQPLAANPGAYPDTADPLLPETMALGSASQAIGLGDNATCQAAGVGEVGGVDARGVIRPSGHCDAGAYQSLDITLSATGPVTIQGGLFDTATVSGTVYTDVYDLAGMPVALSVPAGSGSLSPAAATTGAGGDFGATYTAPASVPASAQASQPVTVTATTYGQPATAVVDVLTPPELTALSAPSGTAGSTLTLTGLHFVNPGATADYVTFTPTTGGPALKVIPAPVSDTSATVTVPAKLAAGTKLEVAIWNSAQGLFSNALTFTVTAPGGSGGPPSPGGIPVSQNVPVSNTCGSVTLPAGASLQANAGSPGTPANLAPDARAASCVFTLSGAAPAQPLAVTLQYNPDALNGLPPARISLFRLRSDGTWTFLPSTVDGTANTVTAGVAGPTEVVALADIQVFADVPATYWAYGPINVGAAAELVDGFPPPYAGPYEPDGPLTRAQAAKMVVVDAQVLPRAGSTPFTDVQAGDWFAPYVAAGYQAGIVQGMSATTFGPNQPVTREQFAVMLARALQLKGTAALTFADDSSIAPWALPAVQAVVAAGYFQGMPGNLFQPQATLTRAQGAQVMARVIAGQAPTSTP